MLVLLQEGALKVSVTSRLLAGMLLQASRWVQRKRAALGASNSKGIRSHVAVSGVLSDGVARPFTWRAI